MKKPFGSCFLSFLFASTLVFVKCSEDPEQVPVIHPEFDFQMKNVSSTMFTASIHFTAIGNVSVQACDIEYSRDENFQSEVTSITIGSAVTRANINLKKRIEGLTPDATYYARSAVKLEDNTIYSDVVEFKTLPMHTFAKFEQDPSSGTAPWNSKSLSFTMDGKGYIFRSSDTNIKLAEFDPETETWNNKDITHAGFKSVFFTITDLTSFTLGNRNLIAFGYTSGQNIMNRSVYEIDLETAVITELSNFNGTNAWFFETISINDRAFAFTLTYTNALADSINVHEFDAITNLWRHKAKLAVTDGSRDDLFAPFVIDGNIYIMTTSFDGQYTQMYEYNIDAQALSILQKKPVPPSTIVETQGSFLYGNKCYYFSNNYENQYLSMIDLQNSTISQLAVYPKEGNMLPLVMTSFIIDNIIYTESRSGEFYQIEL